jgi:hypothetical protein
MALDDDALFTAATGYIFIGPTGTTAPTPTEISDFDEAEGLGVAWTNIGHTSREDLPEFGFDGGETETRGTWQNAALREVVTEATVDYVTFQLHQFDLTALSLYYGQANAVAALPGEFHVSNAATAGSERSICMVIVDGDAKIGFYARKASIRREEAISLATDQFAALPLRATFLKDGVNEMFRWISEDMPVNPDETP